MAASAETEGPILFHSRVSANGSKFAQSHADAMQNFSFCMAM